MESGDMGEIVGEEYRRTGTVQETTQEAVQEDKLVPRCQNRACHGCGIKIFKQCEKPAEFAKRTCNSCPGCVREEKNILKNMETCRRYMAESMEEYLSGLEKKRAEMESERKSSENK